MKYYKDFNACQLCGDKESELQESHLIPKFAIEWVKETSATKRIRGSGDPEEPLQDGLKPRMLCAQCENKFSKWENKFSTHIFKRVANYRTQTDSFVISKEHQLCILSIFWRTLCYGYYNPNSDLLNKDKSEYKKLLKNLKKDLLNNEVNIQIHYSAIERDGDYLGLGKRSVITLERSFGDGTPIFLGSPHRYYSVLHLPFFVFYIFGGNWLKNSMLPTHLFKTGVHTPKSANDMPDIIKKHIDIKLDKLESQQENLSETSINSINSAFEKNTEITGTDKSIKTAKELEGSLR